MFVIGLTGGIGSGKTAVANSFAKRGVPIIDADVMARQLTTKGKPLFTAIVNHFKENLVLPDGNLDRAKLRQIIFINPNEKQWLENLLHPAIENEMQIALNDLTTPYAIVVVPLLIEVGQYHYIDRILVVDSSIENQVNRVMKRDNVPNEEVMAIINAQIDRSSRLAKAHDVVNNDSTLKDLDNEVEKLHQKYLKIAQSQY